MFFGMKLRYILVCTYVAYDFFLSLIFSNCKKNHVKTLIEKRTVGFVMISFEIRLVDLTYKKSREIEW